MGHTMGCVYGTVVAIGNWVSGERKTDGITSLARLTTNHKMGQRGQQKWKFTSKHERSHFQEVMLTYAAKIGTTVPGSVHTHLYCFFKAVLQKVKGLVCTHRQTE